MKKNKASKRKQHHILLQEPSTHTAFVKILKKSLCPKLESSHFPGPDGIPAELLKAVSAILSLHKVAVAVGTTGHFPEA